MDEQTFTRVFWIVFILVIIGLCYPPTNELARIVAYFMTGLFLGFMLRKY
jgi:hypothetical protein